MRWLVNTEWEIIVLNSLKRFGNIQYEKEKNKKKPDILFTHSKHNFKVFGDITYITGKQDNANIPLTFKNEFKEITDKEFPSGYWEIFINGNSREMEFCNAKPDLKLKTKKQREDILNGKEFAKFIEEIKENPEQRHYISFKENKINPEPRPQNQIELFRNVDVDVKIICEPREFYQVEVFQFNDRKIVKIEDDEIYRRLEGKYNDQLAEAAETKGNDCLGIFLCDGIGDTFRREKSRNVIYKFLSDYKEIDFVLTLSCESKPFDFFKQAEIKTNFYQNKSKKLNSEIVQFLEKDFIKGFAKPVRTVEYARDSLKYNFMDKETFLSYGDCSIVVSSNEIKVSSITILKLLAGKITLEKFFDYWQFDNKENSVPNKFLSMWNEGRLFSEAKIEKCENDVDRLIFTFGEPDPAISPFKLPDY